MSDVLVIAGSDVALGFCLAGVESVMVSGADEAADLLREEIRGKAHKVIIIDEHLFEKAPPYTRRAARRSLVPMILAVPMEPSDLHEGEEAEYVQNLVREAVGFSVKI